MSRPSKDPTVLKIVHARELQEKTYVYHAHDFREVLTVIGSKEDGLTEAQAETRRATYGQNQFTPKPRRTLRDRVWGQIMSPLAIVLIAAFFVTLALGEYIDASVIFIALTLALLVGIIQEGKASRAFDILAASQTRLTTVIRDGKKQQLPIEALVPGDVVILQSGSYVPADLRITYSKQLTTNESALTGEWAPVKKQTAAVPVGAPLAERASMAWMGTYVTGGYGRGVVVATGDDTQMGVLARSLSEVEEVATPLQVEMRKISNVMLGVIIAIIVVIFVVGVLEAHTINQMLLMAIAIAVASIPEGLPAAVTIVLAISMESLLKRGGLVRNLLAAETLGATTYVLTDKTGTLTEARMQVSGVVVEAGSYISRDAFAEQPVVRQLLDISLAATDAYTDAQTDTGEERGESVEVAILDAAKEVAIDETENALRVDRIDYLPFSSEQRYAAGLVEVGDTHQLCVNGAPHFILKRATQIQMGETVAPLTETVRAEIATKIAAQSNVGKRLIAVATKYVDYDDMPETEPDFLDELTFLGLVILDDPIRSDVAEAIAGVQSAGARVVLVTGDNPQTALSIAVTVGIAAPGDPVLTGADLEHLSDDELVIALRDISVFARVLPQQKMRLVTTLQKEGEIVAMTGDGVNDAAALRRAHIGVAIGSGTEVAKEASDLVLVQDTFATIYAAIEEGRRIIGNVRKVVGYLLSTSLTELVLILLALIVSAPIPILPAQILWANIIEEGFMGIAFAFEKSEPRAMRRRPHDIHEEGILSSNLLWFITFVVTILSMITGGLYFILLYLQLPLEVVRSVMFVAISIDSLFIAVSFRSLHVPLWRIPLFENRFFLGSFLVSAAALVAGLTVPPLAYLLSYQPLPVHLLVLPIVASFLALVVVELGKALFIGGEEA